jgi:REP element-mobilizing transposase RayT
MAKRIATTGVSGTGVPPVNNHGQDARATCMSRWLPVDKRHGAYLPHWSQDGASYFVTFRLGDSLPAAVVAALKSERETLRAQARQGGRRLTTDEEARLRRLYSEKVERYLDAGHGACWMKQDAIAKIVADALLFFDEQRYDLWAWVVMPNHVHVVVQPRAGHLLSGLLHSWKSYTSKEVGKAVGARGQIWQDESFDHLIRDAAEWDRCIRYILSNPTNAGLADWKWVGVRATGVRGTGVPPVNNHGQDGRATHATGVPPVNNRR